MRSAVALLVAAAAAAWTSVVQAEVVVLTPDNFDSVVGRENPVLVEFYAPWCGHCKNLAPEYELVGETFKAGDGVVIAKVDADAHQALGSKHGVEGFPTLKWFDRNSQVGQSYEGGRTADDIVEFINGKTGLQRRVKKAPTAVTQLSEREFAGLVLDPSKAALVEFYAPWCGHCKALAPTYEKLAAAFASEKDVTVAAVDATKESALAQRYGVQGYPTIKFFPRGANKEAEDYKGGRDLESLVKFINDKTGSQRTSSGGLSPTFGRLEAFDEIALLVSDADDAVLHQLLHRARLTAEGLEGDERTFADFYIKAVEKVIEKGKGYIKAETARLDGMIGSEAVPAARKDQFRIKRNVLSAFL